MKTDEDKINRKKRKRLVKQLQSVDNSKSEGIFATDDWEKVDMQKQLHPISFYINDREEMIRQMFSVIQGQRLKNMLPPILKDVDLDELKADCLIHLVGMSSKRIKATLAGHDLEISSDESDSESETIDKKENTNCIKAKGRKQKHLKMSNQLSGHNTSCVKQSRQRLEDNCSSISGDDTLELSLSNSEMCEQLDLNDDIKLRKAKKQKKHVKQVGTKRQCEADKVVAVSSNMLTKQSGNDKVVAASSSMLTKQSGKEVGLDIKPEPVVIDGAVENGNGEKKGKTLLEILELEMRARAIRALLERPDAPDSDTVSSQLVKECATDGIKTEPCDDVDLTTQDTIDLTIDYDFVNKDFSIKTEKETDDVSEVCNTISTSKEERRVDNSCNGDPDICISENCDEIKASTSNSDSGTVEKSDVDSSSSNSWAQRWLDKKSKEVKLLVSTSKVCTTMRKKMKMKSLRKITADTTGAINVEVKPIVDEPVEFKGSIDEYNMLTCSQDQNQQPSTKDVTATDIENVKETVNTIVNISEIDNKEVDCVIIN